jgi:hypothetical protein
MSDDQVRALQEEAQFGRRALLEKWEELLAAGPPSTAARHYLANRLIEMAAPDRALRLLDEDDSIRGQQLRALALSRGGGDDGEKEAIKILQKLWGERQDEHTDAELAETGGLLGGRYKKWYRANGGPWLDRAYEVYKDAWERTGDTYPGINCAALALELGRSGESRDAAKRVLKKLDEAEHGDEWHHATRAEALLLLAAPDDPDALKDAENAYRLAVRMNPSAAFNAAVMRRQARVELELLGFEKEALDVAFPLKSVAAFTGHRIDEEGRNPPRFAPEMEGAVRTQIRDRLKQANVGFGVSSGAQGGDILFLEEVLRGGGAAKVLLPFPLRRFRDLSVGDAWWPRLERILADPMVELVELLDEVPAASDLEGAFADCNERILEEAVELAEELDQEPRLIAVWDGGTGDGGGGTADAVARWEAAALEVEIIHLGTMKGRSTGPKKALGTPDWMPTNRHCLAVGINQYSSLPRLYNAEGDAHAVADLLEEQHGFRRPLKVMGDEATFEGISSAFSDELIPQVTPDDLVVVYYSGHGEISGGGYYLSTRDCGESFESGVPSCRADSCCGSSTPATRGCCSES